MDRRRFLVIAAVASAAGLAPRAVFAAGANVASVRIVRWPREILQGVPGRCAGMRRSAGFDQARMLATR